MYSIWSWPGNWDYKLTFALQNWHGKACTTCMSMQTMQVTQEKQCRHAIFCDRCTLWKFEFASWWYGFCKVFSATHADWAVGLHPSKAGKLHVLPSWASNVLKVPSVDLGICLMSQRTPHSSKHGCWACWTYYNTRSPTGHANCSYCLVSLWDLTTATASSFRCGPPCRMTGAPK